MLPVPTYCCTVVQKKRHTYVQLFICILYKDRYGPHRWGGGIILKLFEFYSITGEENQKREEKGWGKISNLMERKPLPTVPCGCRNRCTQAGRWIDR